MTHPTPDLLHTPNASADLKDAVLDLHPKRFPGMSPKMAFLLQLALGTDYGVRPSEDSMPGWSQMDPTNVGGLCITSDGFLQANGMNAFFGAATDWEQNLEALLRVVYTPGKLACHDAIEDDAVAAERCKAVQTHIRKRTTDCRRSRSHEASWEIYCTLCDTFAAEPTTGGYCHVCHQDFRSCGNG